MNSDTFSRCRNLFIQLNEPHGRYYTSGDSISGTIRVAPTLRPQRVAITFKGLHALKIKGTRSAEDPNPATVKDETPFFTYTLNLFTGDTAGPSYDIVKLGVAEDGKVELPFIFTFPYKVELRPKHTFTSMREFEHRLGHLLPPTYTYQPPGHSLGTVYLKVEYFLEAEMFTESKWAPDLTMRQGLLYRPSKLASPSPNTGNIPYHVRDQIIRTQRLNSNYNPDERILKRLKHGLTKNAGSTPIVSFKVSANVPRSASILMDLPISLSLVWVDRSPQCTHHPSIYIRRICVCLIASVSARVCRTSFSNRTEEYCASYRSDTILFDRKFEGLSNMLYDGLPLNDLGLQELGIHIAPGFKTFGLGVKYEIEVRLWGECVKEKFDLVVYHGAIEIMLNSRLLHDVEHAILCQEEVEDVAPPAYGKS
jgi:hypothetical protein